MKRYPKPKKGAWFIKVRSSYLPCSWQGWLLYIPMIMFLVAVFMFANQQADSVTEALFLYFPYFVCTGVVMHWIAANKS